MNIYIVTAYFADQNDTKVTQAWQITMRQLKEANYHYHENVTTQQHLYDIIQQQQTGNVVTFASPSDKEPTSSTIPPSISRDSGSDAQS